MLLAILLSVQNVNAKTTAEMATLVAP